MKFSNCNLMFWLAWFSNFVLLDFYHLNIRNAFSKDFRTDWYQPQQHAHFVAVNVLPVICVSGELRRLKYSAF